MLEEIKEAIREAITHAETAKFMPNELIVPALLIEISEQITDMQIVRLRTLQEDQHNSIMVAFYLNPDVAKQLALPGGEPAEELHITLAFLGKVDEFSVDIEHLKEVIGQFATSMIPLLVGSIGGIGRFAPSDQSENLSPVIALVNMPGLQALRQGLASVLDSAGAVIANDFDFLPHITLAYIDPCASMPVQNIEPLSLAFDTLWLCIGDERIAYKLGKPEETYYYKFELLDKDEKLIDLDEIEFKS